MVIVLCNSLHKVTLNVTNLWDKLMQYIQPVTKFLRLDTSDDNKKGIFEVFVEKYFNVLINEFPDHLLPKYVKTVRRGLLKLKYRYPERMSKILHDISHIEGEYIKEELVKYNTEFNRTVPNKELFLKAMNNVFKPEEKGFDNYILQLKDYASGNHTTNREMRELTDIFLKNVILDNIFKLNKTDRHELREKLKLAIEEFRADVNATPFYLPIFSSSEEEYEDLNLTSRL